MANELLISLPPTPALTPRAAEQAPILFMVPAPCFSKIKPELRKDVYVTAAKPPKAVPVEHRQGALNARYSQIRADESLYVVVDLNNTKNFPNTWEGIVEFNLGEQYTEFLPEDLRPWTRSATRQSVYFNIGNYKEATLSTRKNRAYTCLMHRCERIYTERWERLQLTSFLSPYKNRVMELIAHWGILNTQNND